MRCCASWTFHGQELRIIDAALAKIALGSVEVKRLMTIPGVDATVALSIVAAVGDFSRFSSPNRLVSYLGLNPRVRQDKAPDPALRSGVDHTHSAA
jgi:transposase